MKRFRACFAVLLVSGVIVAASGQAKLKAGTPVRLMLMRDLYCGQARVGEKAPVIVVEDVKDADGKVVLPKGSFVGAQIVESRSAGMMSGVMQRPPRLSLELIDVLAPDGQAVPIAAKLGNKADQMYAFTRANTGRPTIADKFRKAWATKEGRAALTKVAEMFGSNGQPPASNASPGDPVDEAAKMLDLPQTKALLRQGKIGELRTFLGQVQGGRSAATAVQAGVSFSSIGAVTELASVAGDVGRSLPGVFRGQTIRAYAGTPIQAFVSQDVTLK